MTPELVDRVMLALTPEPSKAEEIAARANLGRCQTYQALAHLHDRGIAHIELGAQGDYRRVVGWTS